MLQRAKPCYSEIAFSACTNCDVRSFHGSEYLHYALLGHDTADNK
jgi:hypothetical protein